MGEAGPQSQPPRVERSRASAERTRAREHKDASQDIQSVLAGALRQLVDSTHGSRACAWSIRPGGDAFVVAADVRDTEPLEAPDEDSLEALHAVWREGRPVDLGILGLDAPLGRLASRHGFSAAAPLMSLDREPIAMLFLAGSRDLPGSVRPRTLAALDAAVERLRAPVLADSARSRLARVDDDVCRLDRQAALGSLLAEVVHEIRNPLVSVKTFLHLLPDHLQDAEFQGEFREVVLGELQRMERLLDTLLTHIRPGDGLVQSGSSRESALLGEVFASIVRLLSQRAAERDVALTVELEDPLPPLGIAEDPLRQVLLNLVLNALDAAPVGSEVVLRGGRIDPRRVGFSVEDHGPGVPEALRSRLFEPFFSTRTDRTGGLGLAICKKLVEEAGGSIELRAAEPSGARFEIALPIAE